MVESADQTADTFPDGQPNGIGTEHGRHGRRVKMPDHGPFQDDPEQRHGKWRNDHAEEYRKAPGMNKVGGVCTEQNEFAMGKIEDPHHADDDAHAQHNQHDDRSEAQNTE